MCITRISGAAPEMIIALFIGVRCVPAQTPVPASRSSQTVVGLVRTVTPDAVTVISGERILRLSIDSNSHIWKGKPIDLEPGVHSGDAVVARCAASPSGELHIKSMWVNTVAIFGKIVSVEPGRFEVLTNPDADPASAYKQEIDIVKFDTDTVFDSSDLTDLRAGRQVEVVGVSVDANTIHATQIVVYEGKHPTRMHTDGVIITPDGRPHPRVPQ